MRRDDIQWRRALGRALSKQLTASVDEILKAPVRQATGAHRLGITGQPGAGKSSLISRLAQHRLRRDRDVAILAIDPTSPRSAGSLLGDRIRMDLVADDDRLYIRSIPSGRCEYGLCPNILGLLETLDEAGFDDVILETVGTGQTNYRARSLVDVFILTLMPETGDAVQAMKAGVMELADIYVINKADLPGAQKLASEVASVLDRQTRRSGWIPRIVLASSRDNSGFAELDQVIEEFLQSRTAHDVAERRFERRAFRLRTLIEQRVDEILKSSYLKMPPDIALGALYERIREMI
jgi:LAO/AO transport system kinase